MENLVKTLEYRILKDMLADEGFEVKIGEEHLYIMKAINGQRWTVSSIDLVNNTADSFWLGYDRLSFKEQEILKHSVEDFILSRTGQNSTEIEPKTLDTCKCSSDDFNHGKSEINACNDVGKSCYESFDELCDESCECDDEDCTESCGIVSESCECDDEPSDWDKPVKHTITIDDLASGYFGQDLGVKGITAGAILVEPKPEEDEFDNVTNPRHYNIGGIETIELMKSFLTYEEFVGYCKGNIIKYRERHSYKGQATEDLEKAKVYYDILQDILSEGKLGYDNR